MKKGEWTFITNHGRVLAYLAKHEKPSVQEIAQDTLLSIGAVGNIINDLKKDGYISLQKEGRRNRYEVYPDRPMRHMLERHYQIGSILVAIGCKGHKMAMKADKQSEKLEESLSK